MLYFSCYVIVLLIKLVIDKVPSFRILNDLAKFIWLMTCEDTSLINALADFVVQCFELRNLETMQ